MRTRLRSGEELADVVRRHVIVLVGPFALALFLLGCLIGAWFIKRPYVLPAAGIALGCATTWAIWSWLDWRCDLWAITSQRVIDESGVLSVRTVDSPLDKIHNLTCTQSLLGRMLGYGTVNIQTAAEVGSTTIEKVAHPMEVKETLLDQQEKSRSRGMAPQAAPFSTAAGAAAGGGVAVAPTEELRECPYCAETIKARAKVCRFCGRNL